MIVNSFLISFFSTYVVGCEIIRQLVFYGEESSFFFSFLALNFFGRSIKQGLGLGL